MASIVQFPGAKRKPWRARGNLASLSPRVGLHFLGGSGYIAMVDSLEVTGIGGWQQGEIPRKNHSGTIHLHQPVIPACH